MDRFLAPYLSAWVPPDLRAAPSISSRGLLSNFLYADLQKLSSRDREFEIVQYIRGAGVHIATMDFLRQLELISDLLSYCDLQHVYLMCPYSGCRVNRLYAVQERLISKEALSLPQVQSFLRELQWIGDLDRILDDPGRKLPAHLVPIWSKSPLVFEARLRTRPASVSTL